jgi:cellulose synthase operon protein C
MEAAVRTQKKLIAVLISASLAGAVQAADSQAVSVLMDQAKYWKDKGRGDLAAEAWQKVLLVDPNNSDALFGLGTL